MNELTGKCVNVVLAVEMGRGLGFVENPIKIVANFNGRPLESDQVGPKDCPIFNTELVWETEKRELRKARAANAPVRVEIQVVDPSQRRERVGFILLSPRSANIIPFDSKLEVPFKWQKLLGVLPERKSSHPELYLSLTIRDLGTTVPKDDMYLVDVAEEEEEVEESFDNEGEVFPIQYLQDGFIQIGNEECNETFLLSITIQVAYNLDLLLPEVLVFNQCREKYYISFKLLGITIRSKPFCRDLHANIPMNEKIVIRIRSEYDTLRTYLSEHCQIHVSFYCGRDKLGVTDLAVNMLLQNVQEEKFLMKGCSIMCEHKCFFKFPSDHGIVPKGSNGREPYVEVATTVRRTEIRPKSADTISITTSIENMAESNIENMVESNIENMVESNQECVELPNVDHLKVLISPKSTDVTELPEVTESPSKEDLIGIEIMPFKEKISPRSTDIGCGDVVEEIETNEPDKESPRVSGCGDRNEESPSPDLSVCEEQNGQSEDFEIPQLDIECTTDVKDDKSDLSSLSTIEETVRTTVSELKAFPSLGTLITPEEICQNITMYQQYCLDVILENITLKKHLKAKKLCFKFKHPRAATATMVTSEMFNEDDYFGETIFLENTRCKMFFISSDEHIRRMVYAWPPKLILTDENEQMLTEELDIYTAMFLAKQRTECSYVTEWKTLRTYEPLAKISISMYLQEYGLTALPQPTECDLLPVVLDEEIAVKELQELQEWKQKQKAQFFADLKIMEKQQMCKMREDWAKKKKELQGKLNKSVVRCRNLSQELQTAVNNIRTKKALEIKESELNSTPNCSFKDILQKNAAKYSSYDGKELIETISRAERDNKHLNGIIDDLRTEIQQIKKTALTKEQTASLLQQLRGLEEKFEEAQKAKGYFKEQWKKAVREIHDLKSEEQKLIQEKIQNQMNELSQLSLDSCSRSDVGSYEKNNFSVPVHTPEHFEDFNWNNLDFSMGMPHCTTLVSYSNPNI